MTRRKAWLLLGPSLTLLIGWGLFHVRPATGLLWGLGLLLGIALHRSRFCVAAAVQDAILFADTAPAKAVLLALALSLAGFGTLQYLAMAAGAPLPGNIYAITPATVVGALLFGIGSVPAGGCTITLVLRLGEGHLRFLWTLLGLLAGALAGAWHYGWWMELGGAVGPVHLPTALGWTGAVAVEAALIGSVWLLLSRWERKGTGNA
jgi:uncharacterized membrane protein YedE/YeeE